MEDLLKLMVLVEIILNNVNLKIPTGSFTCILVFQEVVNQL